MNYTKAQRLEMSELIRQGLDRARLKGVRLGRPTTTDYEKLYVAALPLRKDGMSYYQMAKELNANPAAIRRALLRDRDQAKCSFCGSWYKKKYVFSKNTFCSWACFKGQRSLDKVFSSIGDQDLFFGMEDMYETGKEFLESASFRYLRIMAKFRKAKREYSKQWRINEKAIA